MVSWAFATHLWFCWLCCKLFGAFFSRCLWSTTSQRTAKIPEQLVWVGVAFLSLLQILEFCLRSSHSFVSFPQKLLVTFTLNTWMFTLWFSLVLAFWWPSCANTASTGANHRPRSPPFSPFLVAKLPLSLLLPYSVGITFLIGATAIQWYILCGSFFEQAFAGHFQKIPLNIPLLIKVC